MGYIYYRLDNSASLRGMSPPALAGGGFGVAAIPPAMFGVRGIYIVINCSGVPENRYIGISGNIGNRFQSRMSVVTELGFTPAIMSRIHVVWGTVRVRNHPLAIGVQTAMTRVLPGGGGGQVPFPNWNAGGWTNANPAGNGAAFTALVDGNLINLEHLLIRFVMTQLGTGGTVSNNLLMNPFSNPIGGQPLLVRLHSAPFGNYNGFNMVSILNPGFQW